MLLNQNSTLHNYTINLNGTSDISFSTGVAGTYQCQIAGESTSLLRFDLTGTLIQHISYGINDKAPDDFFNNYSHSNIDFQNTTIGNDTWNSPKRLKGTVTVNGTLNITANVEVASGTIIIVNGVLNISNNASIKPIAICSGPWEGLQVNLGGIYNMNESAVLFKP